MLALSKKITSYFVAQDIIPQDKYDWCVYFLQGKVYTAFVLFAILCFFSIFFGFINTGVFMLVLIKLRNHTGGYHAKSFLNCFVLSVIIVLFGLQAGLLFSKVSLLLPLAALSLSVLIILKLAPINHPNIHFTTKEFAANKVLVQKFILAVSAIALMLMLLNWQIAYIIISAVMTDALSVVLAKLLKQETALIEE